MSEIRAATVSNVTGTGPVTLTGQYAAKSWVNFNGTSTVAIRESGNVSSITDNGTGDYTANFTTAIVDANYAVVGTGGGTGDGDVISITTYLTTSVRVLSKTRGQGNVDQSQINLLAIR